MYLLRNVHPVKLDKYTGKENKYPDNPDAQLVQICRAIPERGCTKEKTDLTHILIVHQFLEDIVLKAPSIKRSYSHILVLAQSKYHW